jgi:tyrosyl-tRNA synthetase
MPLLVGLDGNRKMSKSYDNYIAFNDTAKDMFGKVMSIPDETMFTYYRFLLLKTDEEIEHLRSLHPMYCKKMLAEELCTWFHGREGAAYERKQFEKVFSQNDAPDNIPTFSMRTLVGSESAHLKDVLAATRLFSSKKEIHRLFEQDAIKVNGQKISDVAFVVRISDEKVVVQAGKRIFLRLLK